MKKICEHCAQEFEVNEKNKRQRAKRFCSHKCAITNNGLRNKDKKRTNEQKRQISKRTSGANNPFFGKHHTVSAKERISKANKFDRDDNRIKSTKLSYEHVSILNGILLADGHIERSTVSGRLTYGCKYKETLNIVKSDLPLNFCPIWESKDWNCFHLKSHSYKELLEIGEKWYPQGTKIVPRDIEITPLLLYWWFVGDGYRRDYGAVLCTDSFSNDDNMFLVDKLKAYGFGDLHLNEKKNRIIIESKSVRHFLKEAGTADIQKEHQYKWSDKWRLRNEK